MPLIRNIKSTIVSNIKGFVYVIWTVFTTLQMQYPLKKSLVRANKTLRILKFSILYDS